MNKSEITGQPFKLLRLSSDEWRDVTATRVAPVWRERQIGKMWSWRWFNADNKNADLRSAFSYY